MAGKRAQRKTITRAGIGTLSVGMTLVAGGLVSPASANSPVLDHQITICHWDDETGTWSMAHPAKQQVAGGVGHADHAEDIIPPFAAGTEPGQGWAAYAGSESWDEESAAFLAEGCGTDTDDGGDDLGTTGGDDGGDDGATDGGDDGGTTGGDDDGGSDGGDDGGTDGGDDGGTDGGDDDGGSDGGDDGGTDGGDDGGTTGGGDDGATDGGDDGGTTGGGTTGGGDGGDGSVGAPAGGSDAGTPDEGDDGADSEEPTGGPSTPDSGVEVGGIVIRPTRPAAQVVAPTRAPVQVMGTTALPRTGTDTLPLAELGFGLVLAGGAALIAARRLDPHRG